MADDPVTLTLVRQKNLGAGNVECVFLLTGGADYDADPGQLCDLSTYFQTLDNVVFGGATAAADALVYPTYINDDYDDADGGAVVYTWDSDSAADAVFENVADTTTMAGYQWRVTVTGTMVTRT